jgi:hypothetical protein
MQSQELFLTTTLLLVIVILFCVGCACWKPAEHFDETTIVDDGGLAAYVPWHDGGEADAGPWTASEPASPPKPAPPEAPASSFDQGSALGSGVQGETGAAPLLGSGVQGETGAAPLLGSGVQGETGAAPLLGSGVQGEKSAAPAPAPAPAASSRPVEAFAGDSFCLW